MLTRIVPLSARCGRAALSSLPSVLTKRPSMAALRDDGVVPLHDEEDEDEALPNVYAALTAPIRSDAARSTAGDVPAAAMDRLLRTELEKGDQLPDIGRLNAVLRSHAREGNVDACKALLSDASAAGVKPSTSSFDALMQALAADGSAAQALQLLTRLAASGEHELQPRMYTHVMRAFITADKLDDALKLLQLMWSHDVAPDAVTYNTLMAAARKAGLHSTVSELYDAMTSYTPIEPTAVTYNILMSAAAARGDVEAAYGHFNEVLQMDALPSHYSYHALMHACSRSRMFSGRTFTLFEDMLAAHYEPDVYSYNILLKACTQFGMVEKAEAVFADMSDSAIAPTDYTYNTLLQVLARDQNCRSVTYSEYSLLRSLGDELALEDVADKLFGPRFRSGPPLLRLGEDALEDETTPDGQPLPAVHADMMRYVAQLDGGADDEDALHTSLIAHAAALDGSADAAPSPAEALAAEQARAEANISRASQLLQEMETQARLPVTVVTLNSLLNVSADALRLRRAEALLESEFAPRAIAPDGHTYASLARMFVRARRLEEAFALLPRVAAAGITPLPQMYGHLLRGCAREGDAHAGLKLLAHMADCGVKPREAEVKRLRKLCRRKGIVSPLLPPEDDVWARVRQQKWRKGGTRRMGLPRAGGIGSRS